MKKVWTQPPGDLALTPDQVDVWQVSILDFPPDSVRWMKSILSPDEIKRADRFHFKTDRHRFVVSHTSLRDILSRYLYKSPQDIEFSTSENGKPIISPRSQLDFNLSHSGDFALIAISKGRKVGVDVERHRLDFRYEKIAQRFFSDQEKSELRELPDDQKMNGFFNCWTRKESYIKALGLGLLLPLDSFDVSLAPNEPAALRATRPDPQEASRWTMLSLPVHPNHTGTVSVEGKNLEFRLWNWHPTQ